MTSKKVILKKEQVDKIKQIVYNKLQKGLIEPYTLKIEKLPSGEFEVEITYWPTGDN